MRKVEDLGGGLGELHRVARDAVVGHRDDLGWHLGRAVVHPGSVIDRETGGVQPAAIDPRVLIRFLERQVVLDVAHHRGGRRLDVHQQVLGELVDETDAVLLRELRHLRIVHVRLVGQAVDGERDRRTGPRHLLDLATRLRLIGIAEEGHDHPEILAGGAGPLDHRGLPEGGVETEHRSPGQARLDKSGVGELVHGAGRHLDQERPALQHVVDLDTHRLQLRGDVVQAARCQSRFADLDGVEAGRDLPPLAVLAEAAAGSPCERREPGAQPPDLGGVDQPDRRVDHLSPLSGRDLPEGLDAVERRAARGPLEPRWLRHFLGDLQLDILQPDEALPARLVLVAPGPGREAEKRERGRHHHCRADCAGQGSSLQARTHGDLPFEEAGLRAMRYRMVGFGNCGCPISVDRDRIGFAARTTGVARPESPVSKFHVR